jgi:hypothetical protein
MREVSFEVESGVSVGLGVDTEADGSAMAAE